MQIKRLELQGFKSFKDKTVIHFDDGITGIVGPNGCGKSNVVDAFFWVMGEQNARHLRGQSMDDLIFSGSDKSPAASAAEVTLVLEMPAELSGTNAPAGASSVDPTLGGAMPTREVAITRKLYRTGDSDYYINKTPCRLRDIQELFMDTGVGARGYSIIQQGQIAKIVQAKPEDRRTMIEEVAGIVKYKVRRKESMRKLEGTEQNLLRITDVINELENQKRTMERQAEKARKYKEWKEKLQSIELHFNALKWEEYTTKITTLDEDIEVGSHQDSAISSARETAETDIAAKRMEATQAANITEEFQQKWMKAGQELNNAENEYKYSQKNIEDLKVSSLQLEQDVAAEQALVETIRAEHEKLVVENASIEEIFADAEANRLEAETLANDKKRANDELEANSNKNRNRLFQLNAELEKARSQEEIAKIRLLELSETLEKLTSEKAEREQVLEEAKIQKSETELELSEVKTAVEEKRAAIDAATNEIRDSQRAMEEERRKINKLHSEQAKLKATLASLEDQKLRHEASGKGVKAVFQQVLSKNEAWKNEVRGTLADFLEVDKGMETAAETALGRALDLVLTSNNALHKDIALALKNGSLGRASFADVESLRALHSGNATSFQAPENFASAVLGPLSQFVRIAAANESSGAQSVLAHLLEKVIVTNSIEAAQGLSAAFPDFSFVTTDGEIVRGGWFMEGGDKSSVSGAYVSRNREITEIGEQLQTLTQNLDKAQGDLLAIEEKLHAAEGLKRELEVVLRDLQVKLSELSSKDATFSSRLHEAERGLRQLSSEWERAENEQQRFTTQEQDALAKTTLLSEEQSELEISVNSAAETVQAARAELEGLQQAVMEARIRTASVTEQKNTISSRLRTSESSLNQHSQRVELMLEQATRKQMESEETLLRIEELSGALDGLRNAMVEAEQAYRESRGKLDLLNNEVEELRSSAQAHSTKERELKEMLMTKRLELQRVQGERDNLNQNTFERYGIILAEYAPMPETQEQIHLLREAGEDAISDMQNEVMLLKEKIRKLGEVNPGAVEEYEQIVERYELLSTQKKDLVRSIADLQSTIDKINKVSKDRFERAFGEVNDHFKRVFPVIFGGGHAHLTLTNPEDLLETGVDITAQPPGKKAQNINLLSGGEKTLTAISLLFAIFLVKPSPFCLLDEVDAPLDDANIGRFNALLREMAKRSQFIIITHNKRTMELNDKLYGVTMEDAGVSKMVSIQLSASA